MSVGLAWKLLQDEGIAQSGPTFSSIDPGKKVILGDTHPYVVTALENAIKGAYHQRLMNPKIPQAFVSHEEIARRAAALLKATLEDCKLLDPSPIEPKVIVLDGALTSKGETPVRQPEYLVPLEKTLAYLRLPAVPEGDRPPPTQICTIGQLADANVEVSDFTFRQDSHANPIKTKTWEKMAQARLVVSAAFVSLARTLLLTVRITETPQNRHANPVARTLASPSASSKHHHQREDRAGQ
jgi:hypothetical protein